MEIEARQPKHGERGLCSQSQLHRKLQFGEWGQCVAVEHRRQRQHGEWGLGIEREHHRQQQHSEWAQCTLLQHQRERQHGERAFALSSNSEGIGNTASGNAALVSNTTGSYNTASGAAALFSNTTGINNTASGVNALFLSTGKDNTAIGHNAGSTLITGDNNIYVGNSGKSEESDTIRIGNSDHTIAFIAGVQVVPPSAKRFKEDIHDMDDASGDLMSLRPVTFRYKKDYASGDTRLHYGLIAEEVAEVYPELVVNDGTGRAKTVEYQKLTTMLLNELQKQHRKIEAQERRNADLMARLARLEQEQSAEVSEVLH